MRTCSLMLCVTLPLGCFLTGCGSKQPPLVKVSGQVVIDGKPLTIGFVRFIPENYRAATGKLNEHGRFTLTTFEEDDGAVVGKHRIQVTSTEPIDENSVKWHAPKKYSNYQNSELTATIDGPVDDFVINLTWNGQRPFSERD